MRGPKVGKQLLTIPLLISMTFHKAPSAKESVIGQLSVQSLVAPNSQVMSLESYRRYTLNRYTLVKTTYEPRRKMPVRKALCTKLVCSFHTWGIGRHSIPISQRMLGTDTHRKVKNKLIQVPSSHGSQSLFRGVHWKMAAKLQAIVQDIATLPRIYPPTRTL